MICWHFPYYFTGYSLLAAESTLVTGTDYEAAINEMALMGFERDLVVRAMRASFNNPDRAMDMLLSVCNKKNSPCF